jgi:hypothetical protein
MKEPDKRWKMIPHDEMVNKWWCWDINKMLDP